MWRWTTARSSRWVRYRARGRREISAAGAIVTPGFVDIHTHYDGQATWASRMSPSNHHGVTTVVMGNCGVGFAPVKRTDHDLLIELMEGVEDIPGAALHEGLSWDWETFPQYLDYLSKRRFDMDIAAQLPHAALRVYVMGERGANREPATADDIAQMRVLAREAAAAGAIGFSTSRTLNHRSSKGAPTPSLTAEVDELVGIAMGLKDAGHGVLELISDFGDLEEEFGIVERMSAASGRPISISLAQGLSPNGWKKILGRIQSNVGAGRVMRGQVAPRPIGIVLGLSTTLNPLLMRPSYIGDREAAAGRAPGEAEGPGAQGEDSRRRTGARIRADEAAGRRFRPHLADERSAGLRAGAGRRHRSARPRAGSRAARVRVRSAARNATAASCCSRRSRTTPSSISTAAAK